MKGLKFSGICLFFEILSKLSTEKYLIMAAIRQNLKQGGRLRSGYLHILSQRTKADSLLKTVIKESNNIQ